MNDEVFLSLLALDAYNRGYGQNVLLVPGDSPNGQNEVGRQIGMADIDQQDITEKAQADGFYAIAYQWNDGGDFKTVISYRGTNFPANISDPEQVAALADDVLGGWSMFLGFGDSRHPVHPHARPCPPRYGEGDHPQGGGGAPSVAPGRQGHGAAAVRQGGATGIGPAVSPRAGGDLQQVSA